MLYAARSSESGDGPQIGHLFQGLADAEVRGPMLALGGLYLASMLVLMLLGIGLLGGGMLLAGPGEEMDAMSQATLGAGGLIWLLFVVLISALVVALFIYAAPLVMFDGVRPMDAIKASFSGSLKNMLPMLLAGLIYLVLGILASIPLALGWLVLGPVTIGALYASYRDIFTVAAGPSASTV